MGEGGLAGTRGATRIAPAAMARLADDFGSVIAFAVAPGHVALDGAPGSSYAAAGGYAGRSAPRLVGQ